MTTTKVQNYLKIYTLLQFILWLLGFIFLIIDKEKALGTIVIAQVLQLAEIYHATKKWSSSNALFCFLQISARLFIIVLIYVIAINLVFMNNKFINTVIFLMLLFWAIAEIIRNAYYLSVLHENYNSTLKWLRYSAFLLCYPVGVVCEFILIIYAIRMDVILPVKIILIGILILYLIYFPKLFRHLYQQRKEKIV